MKKLIILCGASGSGKTSWIRQNNLTAYALSADSIRQMLGLTHYIEKRHEKIPTIKAHDDAITWEIFNKMLNYRMEHGATTIIDNTNTTQMALDQLQLLASKYNYYVILVDFMLKLMPIQLEVFDNQTLSMARKELLERNDHRKEYPVPNRVLVNQIKEYGELRKNMFYKPENYNWFEWLDAKDLTKEDIKRLIE